MPCPVSGAAGCITTAAAQHWRMLSLSVTTHPKKAAGYNYHSNLSLTNVTFNSNAAGNSGGGMYSDGSSPLLLNSTLGTNTAGISGGAMLNKSKKPLDSD